MIKKVKQGEKFPQGRPEPIKPLDIWEEAGLIADTYRGGGWMVIRQMLVDFHQAMNKKGK